jgi:hypothetical protein
VANSPSVDCQLDVVCPQGDPFVNGRSVWNRRWLLIIPGASLSAQPQTGLDAFIDTITDIKFIFETYFYAGSASLTLRPSTTGKQ